MNKTAAILTLVLAPLASGQALHVSDAHKYSWGENIGFMNWRDAGEPDGALGVLLEPTFLSGYVWAENVGWINLGDGDGPYGNTSGRDFGVNRAANGQLSGYAWGENIGWINFSGGALAAPRNPARVDAATGRLRGYAWGENVGWINLDDQTHFVSFRCPGDFNDDGVLNFFDVQSFLAAFAAQHPDADLAPDGSFNFFDVQAFLQAFAAGCDL